LHLPSGATVEKNSWKVNEMHLLLSVFFLALTVLLLLAAIRNAVRTFRRIYVDQHAELLSPGKLLVTLAWNYFSAVLTFAQVYRVLFTLDPDSFNVALHPLDGLYFSITTISGTGFGDILPKSYSAKMAVCVEIVFGYFLTVILFSSFAGRAFRKAENTTAGKGSDPT